MAMTALVLSPSVRDARWTAENVGLFPRDGSVTPTALAYVRRNATVAATWAASQAAFKSVCLFTIKIVER